MFPATKQSPVMFMSSNFRRNFLVSIDEIATAQEVPNNLKFAYAPRNDGKETLLSTSLRQTDPNEIAGRYRLRLCEEPD